MTATVFTEAVHPFAYLVSEMDNSLLPRDSITIAASQTIVVGQVLGRTAVLTSATSSSAADASNTGIGTLTLDATTPVLAGAMDGVYRVVCVLAGASGEFVVNNPRGIEIGRVAVGATFATQIKFALADGNTHFAAGDAFSVTVGIAYDSGEQFAALNLSASDGTQIAYAIAGYPVTTGVSSTAHIAATVRNAEVRSSDLSWPNGITTAQKVEAINQLRARNIILR
jgi:hypothetical protein